MSVQSWHETLVASYTDGPTITAIGAVTCLPTYARLTLPTGFWAVGRKIKIVAQGRITCAITTPGTARFDIRTGPTGTIVAFDTGALNLNTAGKTTVPWWLEVDLTCRAIGSGTSANLFGFATFQSEAVVGSPANTAGGNASLLAPVGAPVVGTGFDSTAANVLDMFFTQTVATGSMTLHSYELLSRN